MECPYLETSREGSICSASTRHMKPSASDMNRYCTMEAHDHCPLLLAHTLRRGSHGRLNWAAATACLFLMIGITGASGVATAREAKAPSEPMVEYFKLDSGKLTPDKVKANAYYEIEKGEKIYVSPPGWVETSQSDAHLGKGQHLTIGANYAAQKGIEYKGNDFEEDRTLTGFDISGHWNAITGQFEYNTWKEEYTDPGKSDKEPKGWYLQAGYFIDGPDIEPVVRYEVYDQDSNSDDKQEKTTTLGVNWYGKGHSFKVGANWAHTEYDPNASGWLTNADTKDVYQVQAQLYF